MSTIKITKHELRALLHWASVGIENSLGGSYNDAVGSKGIIMSLAKRLKFRLYAKPLFKS
jgi:hypothetical protein